MTVDQPASGHLRLVVPAADEGGSLTADGRLLADVCRAFEQAVGWRLEYAAESADKQNNLMWSAPVDPGVGASLRPVKVSSERAAGARRPIARGQAVALAGAVSRLWGEITALRGALAAREAELAADVPVVARPEEPARSAQRLAAVLRSGAEAIGCQAAGLYLLDAGTTALKLRACWGLSERKLLAPPRPLRGALADLEALLGHAVVLAEPALFDYWQAPESCGAAVCVPVSSSTTPLGTMWVFSQATRDFTDEQTNLLETVAGRLAAELEREVLVAGARQSDRDRRQLAKVHQRQVESRPHVAPLIDGWSVAGQVCESGQVGRAFFDWFAAADHRVALTLGAAVEEGLPGVLTTAELRAALRAQAAELARGSQGLFCAHQTLAGLSAGSCGASAFCGLVEPRRDVLRFSSCGATRVWLASPGQWSTVGEASPPVGTPASISVVELSRRLEHRAALIVCALAGADPGPAVWTHVERRLASMFAGGSAPDSQPLAELGAAALGAGGPRDAALLVIRRQARAESGHQSPRS